MFDLSSLLPARRPSFLPSPIFGSGGLQRPSLPMLGADMLRGLPLPALLPRPTLPGGEGHIGAPGADPLEEAERRKRAALLAALQESGGAEEPEPVPPVMLDKKRLLIGAIVAALAAAFDRTGTAAPAVVEGLVQGGAMRSQYEGQRREKEARVKAREKRAALERAKVEHGLAEGDLARGREERRYQEGIKREDDRWNRQYRAGEADDAKTARAAARTNLEQLANGVSADFQNARSSYEGKLPDDVSIGLKKRVANIRQRIVESGETDLLNLLPDVMSRPTAAAIKKEADAAEAKRREAKEDARTAKLDKRYENEQKQQDEARRQQREQWFVKGQAEGWLGGTPDMPLPNLKWKEGKAKGAEIGDLTKKIGDAKRKVQALKEADLEADPDDPEKSALEHRNKLSTAIAEEWALVMEKRAKAGGKLQGFDEYEVEHYPERFDPMKAMHPALKSGSTLFGPIGTGKGTDDPKETIAPPKGGGTSVKARAKARTTKRRAVSGEDPSIKGKRAVYNKKTGKVEWVPIK